MRCPFKPFRCDKCEEWAVVRCFDAPKENLCEAHWGERRKAEDAAKHAAPETSSRPPA